MRLAMIVRILGLSLVLSAYSAWVLAVRESKPARPQAASEAAGIPLLRLAEAKALWEDGSTLFVDVRSPADYEFGHIAGAVSLPEETFEECLPPLRSRLEHARTIVVYCKSLDCGKSLWTALRLHQQGLTQTVIYPAGWNEWYVNELPIARGGG